MAFCSRFVASGLTAFLIFGCSDLAESTKQGNKEVSLETNVARLFTPETANQTEDFFAQGNKFLEANRYEEALALYGKVVIAAPRNVEAWINRGNAYSGLQRYRQALGSYDRAIAINPNRDEAWYNRGNALSAMRLYQEAEKSYNSLD